jgi:hypothetical protein
MEGFGVCMADRSFECILCQRHFIRFCGDLILTENLICDDCLGELQQMEENELRKHVSQCLAKSALHHGQEFKNEIVRIIQKFSQRETGTSISESIQGRESK